MARTVKPLHFTLLNGITMDQINPHHDVLYVGYVNKINEIEEKIAQADVTKTNATYSEIGELKREEIFATNGVTLHEAYFFNLGGDGKHSPALEIVKKIIETWGIYEKWEADFRASGIAARGWVVLAYNLEDGRLHNYSSDYHDEGGVWYAVPLLVLDVYEHAYFFDFKTARKDYIEAFFKNIDWQVVEERYKKVSSLNLG